MLNVGFWMNYMTKIKKLYKAIGLILRNPYLLNLVIDDNDNWRRKLTKDHGVADGLPELSFHELAGESVISIEPFAFMEGGSIPTDLALLKVLAATFENCKYFEIGTWRGESVANVAEVASQCTTMNLPADSMKEMGLDQNYIDQHAMFSKNLSNVLHLEGNSLDFDFAGLNQKFDLIFIDGDHHYSSIKKDTENVFTHLVHENSIVVWHDYAWQPGNIRFETMAAILDGVRAESRKKIFAVRNTLCAIYYPGEATARKASVIARKDESFKVSLKI